MSYTKTPGKTLNQTDNRHSDGTKLIPAEVQANIRQNEAESINISFEAGYTIDGERLINNFEIEPNPYIIPPYNSGSIKLWEQQSASSLSYCF